MNKITFYVTCIIAGLVMLLASCASPIAQSIIPTQNVDSNVVIMDPSWAHAYEFNDLLQFSDLIVEGTVAGVQETRSIPPLSATNPATSIPSMVTDYKLNISQVLKSYPGFAERSIIVAQIGGTYKGKTYMLKEDGLFQIGENVLLFLQDISNDAMNTPRGETKYSVLMPGGRFHIRPDGKLETPTTGLRVADTYRTKDKSILEQNIIANLPAAPDYAQQAVQGSFLIVEGQVGQTEKRTVHDEDTDNLYTIYSFRVDEVIQDRRIQMQAAPHKTNVYKSLPVRNGDVITVLERSSVFQGKTIQQTWSQALRSGTRMLIFLDALACSDTSANGTYFPLCSKEQQETNKILYFLGGGGSRFIIGSDNHLTASANDVLGRLYNGQPKDRLEQALLDAKAKWEKALENQKQQPITPSAPLPPPPTMVSKP